MQSEVKLNPRECSPSGRLAARLREMASRTTERFAPPMGQAAHELAHSPVRPEKHWRGAVTHSFDPPHDDLTDLMAYLRQLATELFKGQNVQLQITVPPDLGQIKFAPEQFRQLFLLFKEALQNIAAHADCSLVSLAAAIEGRKLEIRLHDNGSSFIGKLLDNSAICRRGGGGLRKIQTRATQLGGALEIASAPGWGTRLTLTLRLHK